MTEFRRVLFRSSQRDQSARVCSRARLKPCQTKKRASPSSTNAPNHGSISAAGAMPQKSMVMSGGIFVPTMEMGSSRPEPVPGGDTVPSVLRVLRERATDSGFQTAPKPLASLGLTPRQTDVLGLLLKGMPNKLIARELKLSVETVKDHVAAVLRTLGVNSRTQAVLAVSQMSNQGGLAAWRQSGR